MQRHYVVLCMGFHDACYLVSTNLEACVICLYVSCHHSLFLGQSRHVTIHCFYLGITVQFTAFCTRAPGKKTMDVEIYSKKIKVKKLVLVTVPDLQQSRLQMAWEFVFRTGCAN